ncbi:MAG: hypothetical protein ACJ76V_11955 [Thermoleophilaceae bacterium]
MSDICRDWQYPLSGVIFNSLAWMPSRNLAPVSQRTGDWPAPTDENCRFALREWQETGLPGLAGD